MSAINPKLILSVESAHLLQELKTLHPHAFFSSEHLFSYFFNPHQSLAKKLQTVAPVELSKILQCFFRDLVQEGNVEDPSVFLKPLALLIPSDKLQEVQGGSLPEPLADEAKLYLQLTQGENTLSIHSCYLSVVHALLAVIESLVTAFGVGDFFKPAESEIRADFKSNKVMMLLSLFTMVTTVLLPLVEAVTAATIMGSALLGITTVSLIWPFIKPTTSHLPGNAVNWTAQLQGKTEVIQGRKESLDAIAAILQMNRHALLVGPSRVGKSLTAKAFAQSLARGDYPELKGKTLFYINTSDIVDQKASFLGGSSTILNEISSAMGRHRKEIILVLDEIHMACKNNEKTADQLKTFLDEGGEFAHVIGITTEQEYNRHVKDNQAFSLRFDRVDIKNTSRDETIKILAETLLKSTSKPLMKEGGFDQIYDYSCAQPLAPQPATAIKLLKRCIHHTEETQRSSTGKKITEISNRIQAIRLQAVATSGHRPSTTTQLEQQLETLHKALLKEQHALDQLLHAKQLLSRTTQQMYVSALKTTLGDATQRNLFVLLRVFLRKSLESFIEEQAKHLRVRAVIDHSLIAEEAKAAGYQRNLVSRLFHHLPNVPVPACYYP